MLDASWPKAIPSISETHHCSIQARFLQTPMGSPSSLVTRLSHQTSDFYNLRASMPLRGGGHCESDKGRGNRSRGPRFGGLIKSELDRHDHRINILGRLFPFLIL